MEKKKYQKPATAIVQLQHQAHLLTESSNRVGVRNYQWHDYEEE